MSIKTTLLGDDVMQGNCFLAKKTDKCKDIQLNNYDNTIAKKEPVLRNKGQDDTPSTSRATTARRLTPLDRVAISIKNKIGVNISTEESQRIINSIPAEKDSEETPKSLIKALNRKKDKRPDLNIDGKVALAYSKKSLKIIDSGIESQKNKLNMEKNKPNIKDDNYAGFFKKTSKLYDRIFNELFDNHMDELAGVYLQLDEQYGNYEEVYNIMQSHIDRIAYWRVKREEWSGRPCSKEDFKVVDKAIAETTKLLSEAKERRNEREFYQQMGVMDLAESLGAELPEKVRKYIAEYEANLLEYFTLPNMIKAREQGIERLQEFREIVITTVENSEHILLVNEVRDAMKLANEVLKNESEKHDEQINEINRDMKDIQIKQDVINTLIANHNGQNKNVDTEEKDIIFPSIPQHEPESNSNVVLEDTLRHKTKSNKKTAVLD